MTILLAGGTGLVGRKLLALLLNSGHDLVSVGRRATGIEDEHLVEITADFTSLPPLHPARTAICALGTTMAQAGSRAAFRAVDHGAVLAFFRAAQAAGAAHGIVITAVGSDPAAPAFYARVKGEVERDLAALRFARLDIVRPGLILGPRTDRRTERRPAEALFQRLAPWLNPLLAGPLDKYGAVEADTIAAAIRTLAQETAPGHYIHHNQQLRQMAARSGTSKG